MIRPALAAAAALLLGLCARATTLVPPQFSELVNGSDFIVHAVVRRVHCEKVPVAQGVKIVTLVDLDIAGVVAGQPAAAVTLQLLGGRVGDEAIRVDGMPRFEPGDEDILFIRANGRSLCPVAWMEHGRYPVSTDASTGRKYVCRADGSALLAVTDVAAPLRGRVTGGRQAAAVRGLEVAEFVSQIRSTIIPGSRLTREN